MKLMSLDEVKECETDILTAIDAFCSKHSIRYSLTYGTLLGAIRHQGFIPWDDDLDICMPREDYERFIRKFDGQGVYQIVTYKNNPIYARPFAKVYHVNTAVKEYRASTFCEYGVFVDIFPMDGIPGEMNIRKKYLKFIKKLIAVINRGSRNYPAGSMHEKVKNGCCRLARHTVVPLVFDFCVQFFNRSKCGNTGIIVDDQNLFPETMVKEYTQVEFEGRSFSAFKSYDRFLTALYGDYMQLPPEDQRCNPHGIMAYYRDQDDHSGNGF